VDVSDRVIRIDPGSYDLRVTFLLLVVAILVGIRLYYQLSRIKEREQGAIEHIAQLNHRLSQMELQASSTGGYLAEVQKYGHQAASRIAELERQLREQEATHNAQLDKRAERAVAASRGSFDGHVAQQIFPASPDHAYHPKDIFHFGGVVDYIVFDGLYDMRHNGGDPEGVTVVFVDVKWGASRLSDAQKSVLSAMNAGRTKFETWHARRTSANVLAYEKKMP